MSLKLVGLAEDELADEKVTGNGMKKERGRKEGEEVGQGMLVCTKGML